MKHKVVDLVCLCLTGAMFGSVALLNLIQPDRPTESAMEQRALAEMPAFSLESLADGSFFAKTSVFVSDTFLYRDKLVGLSKKMDTLRGIDYSVGGAEDSFVLLDNASGAAVLEDEAANTAADQIAAAFDSLLNQTQLSEEETPAVTVPETPADSEIVEETPAEDAVTEEAVIPSGEIEEEPAPEPQPEPETPAEAVVDVPEETPAEVPAETPEETPAETPEASEPEAAPAPSHRGRRRRSRRPRVPGGPPRAAGCTGS